MHPTRFLPVLVLILALAATVVAAERQQPTPVPLDPGAVAPDGVRGCLLGNTSIAAAYSGWWEGYESYAWLVDPRGGQSCDCNLGVALRTVHLVLEIGPDDGPLVRIRLLAADGNGDCLIPGTTLETSAVMPLPPVAADGCHDLALPVQFTCAEAIAPYFVAIDFLDDHATGLDLVGGGQATPCRTYNDWGHGWYDLVADVGFLHDLTLWAEFECCTAPVATERRHWGELKAGYLGERP